MDNTHPLGYGYPNFYYTLKQDGSAYTNFKNGWNVGILPANAYTAGFVGSKLKSQIKQGVLIGDKHYGSGDIIIMNEDPLFRLFWQNGKLLICQCCFSRRKLTRSDAFKASVPI